jgi:transcriptional regulator with XRE-family HTH domain
MIDPLTIKTGADFRAWREGAGYAIRELADTLGVHANTVLRWQRGEPPPPKIALWAMRGLLESELRPGGDNDSGGRL